MQQQFVSQQVVTQQPITVVTQSAVQNTKDEFSPSALSQMRVLSILQVIMGILCIISGSVLVGLSADSDYGGGLNGIGIIGYGIWIGAYFLLLGVIGLVSVSSNSSGIITAAMVLNIIGSSTFWFILLVLSSIGLGITDNSRCSYTWFWWDCDPHTSIAKVYLAADGMMLIMAFAEFVVTVWSAALCCGAVCRCCKTHTGHVVHYSATPSVFSHQQISTTQHQMSTYPSVPASHSYGAYQPQHQPAGYPAGVHQPPTAGYSAAPQGPPSYYQSDPSAAAPSNSGFEEPPATAHPYDPAYPQKY